MEIVLTTVTTKSSRPFISLTTLQLLTYQNRHRSNEPSVRCRLMQFVPVDLCATSGIAVLSSTWGRSRLGNCSAVNYRSAQFVGRGIPATCWTVSSKSCKIRDTWTGIVAFRAGARSWFLKRFLGPRRLMGRVRSTTIAIIHNRLGRTRDRRNQ